MDLTVHVYAPENSIRIASLDAWRGLAALMVVTVHAMVPALMGPYPELRNEILYKYIKFGNYGVQIFFVVSGLCIAQAALRTLSRNKSSPLLEFVMARIRRIYPPYAITSMLAVLLSAVAAYLVSVKVVPESSIAAAQLFGLPRLDYACSILLLQRVCGVAPILPVFWTLCYEAAFYSIVAGAVLAAWVFRRDRLVFELCHAVTLACCVAVLIAPVLIPYPFDLWPEFGLGILVLDILTLRRRAAYVMLAVTLVLQTVFALVHFDANPVSTYLPTSGLQAVSAMAFALLLLMIQPWDKRLAQLWPVRFLAYVGRISYSLYLLHWLVLGPVVQAMKMMHVASASTYWISVVVQVSVAVVAGQVFYQIVERRFLIQRPINFDVTAVRKAA